MGVVVILPFFKSHRMKQFVLLSIFTFFTHQAFTQNVGDWKADFSKSKVFIENLGQFDNEANDITGNIKYAIDFGSTRIFFGEKGVSYSFLEIKKKSREERDAIMNSPVKTFAEHKQNERLAGKYMVRTDEVNLTWGAVSPDCKIEGVGVQSDYHSYSYNDENKQHQSVNFAKGYEKLIYRNIYPNIDVEYTIHPVIGVKYAFIVRPGADLSQINMSYDREVRLVNNELIISTLFGDITDHSPLSFYENQSNETIQSSYRLSGKTVSFDLANYDQNRTLIIDPWVQTPTFPDNWDCVWELDTDAAGNVYIIGGIMPLQLKKYSSAGALLWTHSTPYDTTSWLGTMATDDVGNTYVTNGTYYAIEKVNTAGTVVWNNGNPAGGQLSTEFWNITFNCDQTKLLIGGSGGNLDIHGRIYDVNMANGNINSSVQVTSAGNLFGIPPQIQEVRALTSSPSGKYYFVTLDTIGYINDDLNLCGSNAALTLADHGVNWGYKSENFRVNNTGIKVLRADANFLYTHKGNQLQKRSLSTFAIIASVTIPGGVMSTPFLSDNVTENAGIDIDNCGNIYVGSKTGVYKFNSNLVQQAFYPTTFIVYDVRVNSAGEVVACGGTGSSNTATRSGGVQSFAASACAPITITCCDATICQPQSLCATDAPFTLTVATAGGTFSGPGVNTTTGLFSPSVAGPGTHTITYTLPCGFESITIVVSSCTSLSVCEETNGNLTVSGGVGPYTWAQYIPAANSPITNQTQCTSCGYTWFFGTCLNGALPVTSCNTPAYWSTFATNTTVTPPVTTQIQITDGSGTIYTFNPATVPACVTNPCPTITLSTSAQTNVACFGNSTGSATVSATGGLAPYTYTWNPGALSGPTQTNLAAGTYTVSVTDANSCPGSTTVTITQPSSALSATASATNTNCGASTGTATASPSGGTTGYLYSWAPSGGTGATASNLSAGTYTVTVTDANGCQTTASATVNANGGPAISLVSSQNISCNGANDGAAVVSGSGGSGSLTYSWAPGGLTGTAQNALSAGTYTITAQDAGGCSNSTTVTITEPTAISLSSSNIIGSACGASNGSATVNASGGTGGYSYSWSPSGGTGAAASSLTSGVYTVTVEDNSNCSETISISIPSIGGPTVTLQSSSDATCFGGNDGSATVTQTGGTAPYTYAWTPTGGTGATASNLSAGTYSVAVTDNTGCIGALSVIIGQATQFVITETITDASCGNNDGAITLAVTGGTGSYTYAWTPNGETSSSINALANGNYGVTVTDQNGCTLPENYTIATVGSLAVQITPSSASILQGENVQLDVTGGTSYTWTPATGLSCTTCPDPIATPSSTTTYIVNATDDSGCFGADTITIYVTQICGDIFVPTVFSPNGTGPSANNTLCIYGNCISELSYAIYNRWGEKVFETTDPQICWDGNYKDKPLNPGVFAYKLVVTLFDGSTVIESGNLTLVR
jgi:gliding motility-associated-like protein